MKKNVQKTHSLDWDKQDIQRLPANALRILNVFIKNDAAVLNSGEIRKALKMKETEGKKFGANMATFGKYKKEPLVEPILRETGGNTKWLVNEKYLPLIKEVLAKVEKYL